MADGAVLVTGGTGFVGRRLVGVLHAAGRPVTLAVRSPPSGPTDPDLRYVVVGEIGGATEWGVALDGVRDVVHLAAHVHVAPERAEAVAGVFDEVNRVGAKRLFEAACGRGVATFVFMSSITVLGPESPGRPFDDASPPRPDGPYAASKLAAEEALRARAAGPGCATTLTILRPPLVCGPGVGGNLRSLARLAALPLPLPLGGIVNRRTLVALDNLTAAILAALERPSPGTFVLGDPTPLSTSDIVRHLREGAGRSLPLLPCPVGPIRALAGMLGRAGAARRLFGDLEVDASGFRKRFGATEVVDTAASLRAVGRALRAGP